MLEVFGIWWAAVVGVIFCIALCIVILAIKKDEAVEPFPFLMAFFVVGLGATLIWGRMYYCFGDVLDSEKIKAYEQLSALDDGVLEFCSREINNFQIISSENYYYELRHCLQEYKSEQCKHELAVRLSASSK